MQAFNPVIYAWGTTDTLEYHATRRGSQAVNFVQGDDGPTLPPDAKTFQLHVDNVSLHPCISHALSTYREWCCTTKLIGLLLCHYCLLWLVSLTRLRFVHTIQIDVQFSNDWWRWPKATEMSENCEYWLAQTILNGPLFWTPGMGWRWCRLQPSSWHIMCGRMPPAILVAGQCTRLLFLGCSFMASSSLTGVGASPGRECYAMCMFHCSFTLNEWACLIWSSEPDYTVYKSSCNIHPL